MGMINELDSENLILRITQEIDDSLLSKIKLEFLNSFRLDKVKRIFLDFSSVNQITSTGVSVLFSLKLFFKSVGTESIAVNVNDNVSSIIKSIGLDEILDGESKHDVDVLGIKSNSLEEEIKALKAELSYQKELYNRVTKDLEEKLTKCNAELKLKNAELHMFDKSHSIGELAAGVAHEFNNIIGGILGYAQLAQSKKTEELIDKALTNIIALSKRSEGITSGLLNFSRKKPVKISHMDFQELIQSVLNFTQKQLENNKIIVRTDFQPVDKMYADENLLSQVILNLVINASHAMENGGELYLSLYKENGFIVFKIRDTGIGIKKVNLDKIFMPFYTTKGVLGGGSKSGTGLGLSISRSIAEMHEGKLEVESVEGEGATFILSFPEKIATKEFKQIITQTEKTEIAVPAPTSKILIVDDEELIRGLIAAALSDKGHDILEGVNGLDGVKLYQSHQPDLVFLDVLMPRMNGMDAFLEIKKTNPNAKVIFITGQAGEYLEKILASLTNNKHVYLLRKPFEIDELINVVDVALSCK